MVFSPTISVPFNDNLPYNSTGVIIVSAIESLISYSQLLLVLPEPPEFPESSGVSVVPYSYVIVTDCTSCVDASADSCPYPNPNPLFVSPAESTLDAVTPCNKITFCPLLFVERLVEQPPHVSVTEFVLSVTTNSACQLQMD